MKKMTKRIVSVAFSAALAFTVGAGIYSVCDTQSSITADAEAITVDITQSIKTGEWGACNDYKEAALYRLWLGDSKTNNWVESGVCANENGTSHLLDYIKVNGKTVAEHRTEYGDLLASGETSPITWAGMSADGKFEGVGYMQGNIASEVVNGPVLANVNAYYAPIFINLAYHGPTYGNAIDLYIPTSYISEVSSIEISKDFSWSFGANTWGLTDNVKWVENSFAGAKVIGAGTELTALDTSVTAIDGTYGSGDQFLSFYLSESDYTGQQELNAQDKADLISLDYYDYILIDGEPLGKLMKQSGQGQAFFNVWGRNNSFSTRWPEWMKGERADAVQEITILAGCQFPSATDKGTVYQTTEDVTFTRQPGGAFADPSSFMYADDIQVTWAMTTGTEKELFAVEITSECWTWNPMISQGAERADAYDFNYYDNGSRDTLRKSILIGGKSLYEINTTVDDSDYVYSTWPMTLTEEVEVKDPETGETLVDPETDKPIKETRPHNALSNPTVLEVSGNKLIIYIHKDYVNSLCTQFGDSLSLTILPDISASSKVQGKILTETFVAEIYAIGYDLTLMDGNKVVDVLSIKAGNTIPELPVVEAEHLIFNGWVDAEGNPAPETMPADVMTLYATWKPVPYTATVVHIDGTEESFVFGMMKDEENGVMYAAEEMADIIKACLPADTDEIGYAYVERVPNDFQLRDYTFTVENVQVVFTITFTDAEGNDIGVEPITFTAKTIDSLELPEVPAKEGYTGTWNKTVDRLKLEDVTLYAVYTEVKDKPVAPDSSSDSAVDSDVNDSTVEDSTVEDSTVEDSTDSETQDSAPADSAPADSVSSDSGKFGCSGVVGGIASGLMMLGVAAAVLLKKKEN